MKVDNIKTSSAKPLKKNRRQKSKEKKKTVEKSPNRLTTLIDVNG